MQSDSKLILEVWEAVKDNIPSARREDAAHKLLKAFEDNGVEIEAAELEGEDNHLDAALETYNDVEDDEDGYGEDDE